MYQHEIEDMVGLMCCPMCRKPAIEIKDRAMTFNIKEPLSNIALYCAFCGNYYPVTEDFIPIMWSDNLKKAFDEYNLPGMRVSEKEGEQNIVANMKIYDKNSDSYDEFVRKSEDIGFRLVNAVKSILTGSDQGSLLHLDYACGPGHVLRWLKPFAFRQVGLDVSLKNLRNARRSTGCFAVCADACNLPFIDRSFHLVTESSGLHHILDWEVAVRESCRVCKVGGGVIIDSEPSDLQLDWSSIAIYVFNSRFIFYKILSYFIKERYMFRNIEEAKLNIKAEIYHQPKTGISLNTLKSILKDEAVDVRIITSPSSDLKSVACPTWQGIVLNFLSLRNPWNPDYGSFLAIGSKNGVSSSL